MPKRGSWSQNVRAEVASEFIDFCARVPQVRNRVLPRALEYFRRSNLEVNPYNNPPRVLELRYITMRNLFNSFARALEDGRISPRVRRAFIKNLIGSAIMGKPDEDWPFFQRYGYDPPSVLVLAPSQVCNLSCRGCYANSHKKTRATLPYDIVTKILDEKREDWGSHFTVLTGGEPLLYKSQGKTIFDVLAHAHEDYHLMYTNGTLIDRDVAKRMADLGNVSPAISVEGWEEQTTARRGKGVYKKILTAMDHLRNEGVPFGISVTAMRHNAELLMSDEFIDFWFDQQGAMYGWLFQYMPIGRGITIEDMVTAEQRRWMLDRLLKVLYDDGRFMVDFWNGGPLSEGCVAAARRGGFFYIDWNGDVSPCAFIPYAGANIKEVYAEGKHLSSVVDCGLFRELRDWQDSYYGKKDGSLPQNLFTPCPMRDHHDVAHDCVVKHGGRPVSDEAAAALEDEDYRVGLREYGAEIRAKLAPYWGDGGDKVRGDIYGIAEVPPTEPAAESEEGNGKVSDKQQARA